MISDGTDWYLALFKRKSSRKPMAVVPLDAAITVIKDYVSNIMPLMEPDN